MFLATGKQKEVKMAESPKKLDDNEHQTTIHSPITMKVDAPPEDSITEVDENTKNSKIDDFKICTPSRIPPLENTSTNPFAKTNYISRGILKAPQLNFVSSKADSNGNNDKQKKTNQLNGEQPRFVPLIQTETNSSNSHTTPATTSSPANIISNTVSSAAFVFGQNLQERVIASEGKSDEPKPSTSLISNGSTGMLFSNAVVSSVPKEKDTKTLSESAREYEESRMNKRKYEEVEVITGEEDETNILNINCKLFAFDKTSGSWQERGRGVLRLNDLEAGEKRQSRLVFRTTGSLRVVLNTKIWAEMTVERASEKSVRFTAMDPKGEIRVFLAMASMEDSKTLLTQIQNRVVKEIDEQNHKKKCNESGDK